MDEQRIDDVARQFAAGFLRRRIIAGLIAGVFGPPLLGSSPLTAAACKKVGRKCDRNQDCCEHAECPGNKCRCRSGFRDCSGNCTNVENDKDHCGQCNNRCGSGERCCDGDCVNLDLSDGNCGACGAGCDETEECVGGTCVVPPGGCAPGADSCATSQDFDCGSSPNCTCKQSTEGTTYCAGPPIPGSFCGNCATSADCIEFGPDAFCGASTSIEVCCGPSAQNACVLPCPE